MPGVVYNELNPYAARWLSNLADSRLISPGLLIADDIRRLDPAGLESATRFHAFAGIGVWDHALALAGWPPELPVWTGSCPCQPFSVAGRKRGTDDDRHLWPAWLTIIQSCRPPIIFGEQVASPDGRAWFDTVSADLESLGYACRAVDLCAAGVGAPHIRQRLYFVAHLLGQPDLQRCQGQQVQLQPRPARQPEPQAGGPGGAGELGHPSSAGGGWDGRAVPRAQPPGSGQGRLPRRVADELELAGLTRGFWAGCDWLLCRDGKARPVEPSTFPLAHGSAGRVAVSRPGQEPHYYSRAAALKAIGNAIVPQVAAVFIQAAFQTIFNLDTGVAAMTTTNREYNKDKGPRTAVGTWYVVDGV